MKRILLFTLLKQRWSLRSRIIIGLITYQILLTLGILANDFVVNETAEELVWTSSLNHEMDHQFNRRHTDPDYAWPDTDALAMFAIDPDNKKHAALVDVAPGLYDEFLLEGKSRVILVREIDNQKFALSLNIENLEHNEAQLRNTILIAAASVSLTFCLFIAWAAGWLVRPLRELAQQIQRLTPDQQKQRVQLPENASAELEIIADAMNTYIERNAQFFERERDFINMASHELRTPLSVIDGAAKLSLNETDIPEKTRNRLLRIQDVIRNVNEMINLLLVLAKDPARVHETSEQIFLDKALQDIIKEHNFLAENKNVQIIIETTQQVEILAPLQMVKCALGNLLRNAIENSHDGTIFINLHADSTITITNTSHAMSMDEISALYTRLARNNGRNGGGIGLDLIRRLCEHCKWTLSFFPESDTITFSVKFQHQ